jgi:hypothetical protein
MGCNPIAAASVKKAPNQQDTPIIAANASRIARLIKNAFAAV